MWRDDLRSLRENKLLTKHPLLVIIIIGLAARLLLMPLLQVGFDSDYWATIIRNMQSGAGLYELEGYYYTPVWGYVLGGLAPLQEMFSGIDVMGEKIVEALGVESFLDRQYASMLTTPAFNFMAKIPMLICDILVGYLIYWIIKDKTGNVKKATWGFALWFLCPMIITITSVSSMFDNFSVLFTLLCIIAIRKDQMFLGGALFTVAVLTKFFPAYLIFILIAYIWSRHRDDGKALKYTLFAAVGAIAMFLILMWPQILDGTFMESFSFITNRAGGGGGEVSILGTIISMGAVFTYFVAILVSMVLAVVLYKSREKDKDKLLFGFSMAVIAIVFLYPPAPQYLVLLMAFLICYMALYDRKYKGSWWLLSIGATLFVIGGGNAVLLLSTAAFTDLLSMESLMSAITMFQDPLLFGVSSMELICGIAGVIQYIGILSIIWRFFKDKMGPKKIREPDPNQFSD